MLTTEMHHPSGDLIVPVILDPAIAARVELLRREWDGRDLSSTLADLILYAIININHRLTQSDD